MKCLKNLNFSLQFQDYLFNKTHFHLLFLYYKTTKLYDNTSLIQSCYQSKYVSARYYSDKILEVFIKEQKSC